MSRGKKGKKVAPGTWIDRDLFTSPSFLELSGFAPQLLILFLGKRSINHDTKVVMNKKSITMTYAELEGIYRRTGLTGSLNHITAKGITRGRVIRAFDNLLAHGFLEIVKRGGAYQHDKTIFGLCDDWRLWQPGTVFRTREPDTRGGRGYNGKTKVALETVPVHPPETVPLNKGLGCRNRTQRKTTPTEKQRVTQIADFGDGYGNERVI
jgi:hypothetical protein